jgi:3-hydroxyacyl-CoA dehydrogenase
MSVTTTRHGATLLLTMENGAVNALSFGLVSALDEALTTALDDADCRAIVLTGAGKFFCGGADIAEFDAKFDNGGGDGLRDLIARVEQSPKPVIAAIHGAALGAVWNWRWRAITGWRIRQRNWACLR